MQHIKKILISFILFTIFISKLTYLHALENTGPKVSFKVNLIKEGNSHYLGMKYTNISLWHTYWKNPGDAGLPITNNFFIDDQKVELEELEWPRPHKFIEGEDIITFGYKDEYTLFYKVSNNQLSQFANKKFKIESKWLVCKNICIPGQQIFEGSFSGEKIVSDNLNQIAKTPELLKHFSLIPTTKELPSYVKFNLLQGQNNDSLKLIVQIQGSSLKPTKKNNIILPFKSPYLSFRKENRKKTNNTLELSYDIDWDGVYLEPELPLLKSGIFNPAIDLKFLFNDPITGKSYITTTKFKGFKVLDATKLSAPSLSPKTKNDNTAKQESIAATQALIVKHENESVDRSIIVYLLMAFLGGFILNFMPCVLPIISLKLFGLLKHSKDSKSVIFQHNIFYTLGVIFSFIILGIAIILLKATGESVGWGFHLQSPSFVSFLMVVLFVFALNLFGLFEIVTPGGRKIGNLTLKDGFTGDFFSGVIATILSTPCSAPFLGTALTFAFSSSPFFIIIFFIFIGLGLASPFILTAFFPKIISYLPKPGPWMNTLKYLLGVSLLLTALWLLDVFIDLTYQDRVLELFLLFIMVFFSLFSYSKKILPYFVRLLLYFITFGLFFNLLFNPNTSKQISSNTTTNNTKTYNFAGLTWQAWSEENITKAMANQRVSFVDFGAKWCFTCKINEKVVMDNDNFRTLVKEHNIDLYYADWTKHDPKITSYLKKHGLVGVPAYFVVDKKGVLHNLGEIITYQKVESILNK